MFTQHPARSLALAAVLLAALTGCTPPGGDGGGAPGSSSEPSDGSSSSGDGTGGTGGAGTAECALGHTWNADVPDMAAQLLAQLQSQGSPATSATGTGSQVLVWGLDGSVELDTNYIFTVVAPLGDGLVMTLKQTHTGPTTGSLILEGDVATPSGWDTSGYVVNNAVDINGTTSDMSFPLPDSGLGAVPLTVTCEGNVMTTFAQGGFVTQKWDNFGD